MNRRKFLQSLAAVGAAIAIDPPSIAKASIQQLDAVWSTLVEDPTTFYVNDFGTLSSCCGYTYPSTRRELLDLDGPPRDAKALEDYVDGDWQLQQELENLFDGAEPDAIGTATDWREWLSVGNADVIEEAIETINAWLDGEPSELDLEQADLYGSSGQGYALRFFQAEPETTEAFGIKIIEGEHPGSSYYAAELHMDIAEANALAEAKGIPIRFAPDES